MIKFNRKLKSEPIYLKNIKKILVSKYINSVNFDYTYGNNYTKLRADLNKLTENHCAYCDCMLLPFVSPEIDHFKPKSNYKLLAYSWLNLFPVCNRCNKKKAKKIFKIRPDASNYNWKDYFWIKNTGRIFAKTKEAKFIIDTLDLNSEYRIIFRHQQILGETKIDTYRYITH